MPLINDEPEPTRLGLFTALDSSKVKESESVSHSVVLDSVQLHRLCSPPDSSVLGISQARILERVAISFSRESAQTRDRTQVFYTAGGFFTI